MRSHYRWQNEHGYKVVHRYWIGAWWHAFKLNMQRPDKRQPYRCTWTNDYREAQDGFVHWHVGRKK